MMSRTMFVAPLRAWFVSVLALAVFIIVTVAATPPSSRTMATRTSISVKPSCRASRENIAGSRVPVAAGGPEREVWSLENLSATTRVSADRRQAFSHARADSTEEELPGAGVAATGRMSNCAGARQRAARVLRDRVEVVRLRLRDDRVAITDGENTDGPGGWSCACC